MHPSFVADPCPLIGESGLGGRPESPAARFGDTRRTGSGDAAIPSHHISFKSAVDYRNTVETGPARGLALAKTNLVRSPRSLNWPRGAVRPRPPVRVRVRVPPSPGATTFHRASRSSAPTRARQSEVVFGPERAGAPRLSTYPAARFRLSVSLSLRCQSHVALVGRRRGTEVRGEWYMAWAYRSPAPMYLRRYLYAIRGYAIHLLSHPPDGGEARLNSLAAPAVASCHLSRSALVFARGRRRLAIGRAPARV